MKQNRVLQITLIFLSLIALSYGSFLKPRILADEWYDVTEWNTAVQVVLIVAGVILLMGIVFCLCKERPKRSVEYKLPARNVKMAEKLKVIVQKKENKRRNLMVADHAQHEHDAPAIEPEISD